MKSETLSLKNKLETNYYKRIGFFKENRIQLLFDETPERKDFLLLANKLIEKISHPCNTKEHYQS